MDRRLDVIKVLDYYVVEFDMSEAVDVITKKGKGDLLAGMEFVQKIWDEYIADQKAFHNGEKDETVFGDDDDFFDHWGYECSAYNVVFENMSKLFVGVK
jgi:hypothetical protein